MTKPLRILFVTHSFPPRDQPGLNLGGMQRVAVDLFDSLEQHADVEVTPLALRTSWSSTHWKAPFFLIGLLFRIPGFLRKTNADVVLFSSMVTAAVCMFLGKKIHRANAKSYAIVHGRDVTLPGTIYQRIVPRVFRALDGVLPVSSATGQACVDRGLHPEKVHVVPNGIHELRFPNPLPQQESLEALCSQFKIEVPQPDDLVLCSVGRQVERKGFVWFIENVMTRLPDKVHYWLGGDGPEAEKIQESIKRNGLEKRVRALGRISEMELGWLYTAADLFVMPNIPVPGDMEGFGVVMLEAGLSGTPVVASALEGIRDVVSENRNGHLVPSGETDAFVEAILPYLDSLEVRHDASLRAASYVRENFVWSQVVEKYLHVFKNN